MKTRQGPPEVREKTYCGHDVLWIRSGQRTIVVTNEGRKRQADARCNLADSFDYDLGFKLAFWRLMKGLRKEALNRAKAQHKEAKKMINRIMRDVNKKCKKEALMLGREKPKRVVIRGKVDDGVSSVIED